MLYKKKPVEVEALIWDGNNYLEIKDFAEKNKVSVNYNTLYILTLEGMMKADIGDYIIKGVEGEIYPCKPNIFKKTYEVVNEL